MSVIIRLQNLPWSANASDIREFFKGLLIPEGGVHIVGGELGDAFIAFGSDEDARLAMQKNGNSLKGIQVSLLLSSRTEMQKVIENARQQAMGLQTYVPPSASLVQNSVPQSRPAQPEQMAVSQQPIYHQNMQNLNAAFQSQFGQSVPPAQMNAFVTQNMGNNPTFGMNSNKWQIASGAGQQMLSSGEIASQTALHSLQANQPAQSSFPKLNTVPPVSMLNTSVNDQQHKSLSNDSLSHPQKLSEASSTTTVNSDQSNAVRKDDRSNSSHRDRRNSRSRDDRRRRSRSRSRSRDRDRVRDRDRRRRSNRSRERSRERTRRRRSRSRERTRERERRDRDKDRNQSQTSKEKPVHPTEDGKAVLPEFKASEHIGGIPGLGEIPDNIPKEGLTIYAPVSNGPIKTQNHNPMVGRENVNVIQPSGLPMGQNMGSARQPSIPSLLSDSFNPANINAARSMDTSQMLLRHGINMAPPNGKPTIGSTFEIPDQGSKEPLLPLPRGQLDAMNTPRLQMKNLEFIDEGPNRPQMPPEGELSFGPAMESPNVREQEWDGRKFNRWNENENWSEGAEFSGEYSNALSHENLNDECEPNGIERGGFDGRFMRGGFGPRGRGRAELLRPRGFRAEEFSMRGGHPNDIGPASRGRIGMPLPFARGRGGRPPPPSEFSRERRMTRCVEVLYVPLTASYRAIRDVFSGIYMSNDCIKIMSDEHGRRIDVALIEFGTPRDAYEAFKRSGSFLFGSKLFVNFIDERFYHESVDIKQAQGNSFAKNSMEMETEFPSNSPCLYMTGLPADISEFDVRKYFERFSVVRIVTEVDPESRNPTGGSFIRFSSHEECLKALNALKHVELNGIHVKLVPCSPEEMETAVRNKSKIYMPKTDTSENKSLNDVNRDERNRSSPTSTSSSCVELLTDSIVIKRVSPDINETSVRDFLSDEGLIPEKVFFNRPDSDGKSDVFVVFPKISDVQRALNKNAQKLGSKVVSVELISKPLVMSEMGLRFDPLELYNKVQKEKRNSEVLNQEAGNFSRPFIDTRKGIPLDHTNGANIVHTPAPPPDFGQPGCVVALSNVPFTATTEDILHFFKNFKDLRAENVIRRYDDRNRPTADARVAFNSPIDAAKAVDSLNRLFIGNRPIFLSLIT